MNLSELAKQLGKRGGLQRAKNLSANRRKEIASQGAQARAESFLLMKRLSVNFQYVEAIQALADHPKPKSLKTCRHRLP